MLTAGFPCQSFSVAGKRKGFEDIRGTMFYEVARVIAAKRPALLLLENVRGLLSAQNGYCFFYILQTLDELGYDVEWCCLNSKNFGVPQSRERVFIIGYNRDRCAGQVFPLPETNRLFIEDDAGKQGITSCLDACYYKGARKQRTYVIENAIKSKSQVNHMLNTSGVSSCLNANSGGRHIPQIIAPSNDLLPQISKTVRSSGLGSVDRHSRNVVPVLTPFRPEKRQAGRRFKDSGDPPFTVTAQDLHGVALGEQEIKIRQLTEKECERLQAFPDDWTAGISKTQRYKCLGNAVTTNVIMHLGYLLKQIAESSV